MSTPEPRTGTHWGAWNPDGSRRVCDCGPANVYTGPRFATLNGIEYATAQGHPEDQNPNGVMGA